MRSIHSGAFVVAGLLLTSHFGHAGSVSAETEREARTVDAVLLDFDLGPITGDPSVFRRGSVVAITRIADGHVAGADACANRHLHANAGTQGITIDGHGPYPDPNGTECGYGSVFTEPSADMSVAVHRSGIIQFRAADGEPGFQLSLVVRNNGPEEARSVRVSVSSPSGCLTRRGDLVGLFDVDSESASGDPYLLQTRARITLPPNQARASYVFVAFFALNPAIHCADETLAFDFAVSTTSADPDSSNDRGHVTVATALVEALRFVEYSTGDGVAGATGPPDVRLVQIAPGTAAALSAPAKTPARAAAAPTAYRLYGSPRPGVQPVPANLVATASPDRTAFDISGSPAGWYYIVTAVDGDTESAPSAEVGGALPTVASIRITGSKIVVTGTDFASGTTVRLDGLGFSRTAKIKNGRKVTQKGTLETGESLGEFLEQAGTNGTLVLEFEDSRGNTVVVAHER